MPGLNIVGKISTRINIAEDNKTGINRKDKLRWRMNALSKIRMSITIDEDLLHRVKTLANEDCRNTSSMINKLLRDALLKNLEQVDK
jgi:hypothetical protein